MLFTGKVMIFRNGDDNRLWDPSDGSLSTLPLFGYNTFCDGHVTTADGRVFFAGGHVRNFEGLSNASLYDPISNTYSNVPNMIAGRWYPSTVALANGDVLALSGDVEPGTRNLIPEVWDFSQDAWRVLTDASLEVPRYPASFLAPNGQVFVATRISRYLDTSGKGQWSTVDNHQDSIEWHLDKHILGCFSRLVLVSWSCHESVVFGSSFADARLRAFWPIGDDILGDDL